VHPHTLALTRARSGFCHAAYDPKDGGHVRVYVDGHFAPIQSWSEPQVPSRAFFGYGPLATSLPFGLLALGHEDYWDICHLRGRTKIEVPRTLSVHGVMQDENYEETLIVVEDEGYSQTLGLHGTHGTRRLLKTNAPITAVCGCQNLPFIAYGTAAGEISVYSLKHGKAVLNFARSTA
jgi:hypothetical protein